MQIKVNGSHFYLTSWQETKPVHLLSTFAPKRITVERMMKRANGQWVRENIPCPATVHVMELKFVMLAIKITLTTMLEDECKDAGSRDSIGVS
jgi:hypothetical protein